MGALLNDIGYPLRPFNRTDIAADLLLPFFSEQPRCSSFAALAPVKADFAYCIDVEQLLKNFNIARLEKLYEQDHPCKRITIYIGIFPSLSGNLTPDRRSGSTPWASALEQWR